MLVLDVSGSMGDVGDPETGATKLDLAINAVRDAIDQFQPDDEVGLRVFSTSLNTTEPSDWLDLVEIGPVARQREQIVRDVSELFPTNGTPLYTTAHDAYESLLQEFDPARINAVDRPRHTQCVKEILG